MKGASRQIGFLLRNAVRMDFRTRGGRREHLARGARPFLMTLFIYLVMGGSTALALPRAGISLHAQVTLAYAVAAVMLLLNLLVEYQEILLAPTDTEVLGWRPIGSRTLYVVRVLHVFFYVGTLTAALLALPSVAIALRGPEGSLGVFAAFCAGGLLSALAATAAVLFVYGTLLRRLSAERFQDVLGGVQLVFMLLVIVGYQLMAPEVLRGAMGAGEGGRQWWMWLPPAWFAAIPAAVAGAGVPHGGLWIAAGLGFLVVFWVDALGRLGPGYALAMESARLSGSRAPSRAASTSRLQNAISERLGADPLRRAGFEFFLAQFRGDRRTRVAMMPLVALPVGFLVAAMLLGAAADPYGGGVANTLAAPPGASPGTAGVREASDSRGYWLLFYAVYMLAAMAATVGRTVGRSHDWRAAWVLRAAPVARYEALSSGVLWGVVYALLLPATAGIALVLLLAWRNPVHVAAHLGIPLGLALVFLPLAQLFDFAPPFSQEPQRNTRSRDSLLSFITMLPFFALAFVQHALRAHPLVLVVAGAALCGLAPLAWRAVTASLRISFQRFEFGG